MNEETGTPIDPAIPESNSEEAFVEQVANMLDDEIVTEEEEEEKPKPKAKRKRKPKAKPEPEPEPEEVADDGDEEADEEDPDLRDADEEENAVEGDADEGDEDEEDLKVSIRINGQKADIEDLLQKTHHTVVVNGEEIEVPYEELIAGYQRGRDYSHKTTEVKRLREELAPYAQLVAHAKKDPQFVEYVKRYFETGGLPPDAVNNPLLAVTDEQLADMLNAESDAYDPEKAAQVVQARKQYQQTAAQRQQALAQAQQEQERLLREWAADQTEQAKQAIEEEFGEGAFDKYAPDVVDYLQNRGFSEEEIASIVDARLLRLAYEAALLERGKAGKAAPKVRLGRKRTQHAPPRSARAGQGKRRPARKARDTYRKAVKTQRTDDWLAAIEERLDL